MANFITLPDNISFEELARIWCSEWENVIRFRYEVYLFCALKENGFFKKPTIKTLAAFYPLSRSFNYFDNKNKNVLPHVLSFIKERSNV